MTNREHLTATARDIGTEAYWIENGLTSYSATGDSSTRATTLKRVWRLRGLLDTAEAVIGRVEAEKAAVLDTTEAKNV